MKKIMFNDRYGLTEAVLSGRKTQTRRIIPQSVIQKASEYQLKYFEATLDAISEREAIEQIYFVERFAKLPYQVGEVVAVAQSYKDAGYDFCMSQAAYINKMFTKAEYMPHRIRITNVRLARLNDISEADCIKEGIIKGKVGSEYGALAGAYYIPNKPLEPFITAREAYAALIDRISGKGTWKSNPWVIVYDFELVK